MSLGVMVNGDAVWIIPETPLTASAYAEGGEARSGTIVKERR